MGRIRVLDHFTWEMPSVTTKAGRLASVKETGAALPLSKSSAVTRATCVVKPSSSNRKTSKKK